MHGGDNLTVVSIMDHRGHAVAGNDSYNVLGPMDYEETRDDYTNNIPYPIPIKQVPLWEMGIKISVYVIVICLALFGNVMVVFIVWRNKRMRTTTNCYIVNLAVSDLMVTVSCTWVHLVDDLSEGWVLGAFFCKLNSFAQVLSLVSSIMTLTLISCDRFFGIVFAMKAHLTDRRARTFIILIWICSIGISTPLLFYRAQRSRRWKDHLEIWCEDMWPQVREVDPRTNSSVVSSPARTIYYTFISLVLYIFPIVIMSFAYSLIIWRLWSSRIPGEQVECKATAQDQVKKRIVVMLVMILSVFAICWLPFEISILYAEYRKEKHLPLADWYHHFRYFALFMAHSNSAFNPIIYTCFNENFKKGFRAVFSCGRARYSAMEFRMDSFRTTTSVSRL